jgi:hypothetical protein
LNILDYASHGAPFKAAEIKSWASLDTDQGHALEAFLGGSSKYPLTAKKITDRLKVHVDAPVRVGNEAWTLQSKKTPHGGTAEFTIHKH